MDTADGASGDGDQRQILQRLPLFQELSPDHLARIFRATRERRLVKGEMLVQKGDEPRGFFVVVSGQIKLAFPSAQGNEKVVDIIGPRQSFGEAVMFMDRPYPVYAQALSDALLLQIAKATVFDMLASDASFARAMLAGLSRRLHALIEDVESYSLRSGTQRVIGYLLQHCPDQRADSPATITLEVSKLILASRLNLTPETLSRIFHELTQAGLVSISGRRIQIHQVQRLREFDP